MNPQEFAPSKLSTVILNDLAKSHLTESDVLAVGWYMNEHGDLVMPYGNGSKLARTRYTTPKFTSRNGKQKLQRYGHPRGHSPELYLPAIGGINWQDIKADTSTRLYITEGEKKSLIACKLGLPCIGISGVDCWSSRGKPLPQWEEFDFTNREVVIAFDSDITDKPAVKSAERRLAQMLSTRKAQVYRLRLSEILISDFEDYLRSAKIEVAK